VREGLLVSPMSRPLNPRSERWGRPTRTTQPARASELAGAPVARQRRTSHSREPPKEPPARPSAGRGVPCPKPDHPRRRVG
jgi:hypothetical protein